MAKSWISYTAVSRQGSRVAWTYRLATLLCILMGGFLSRYGLSLILIPAALFLVASVTFLTFARTHSGLQAPE